MASPAASRRDSLTRSNAVDAANTIITSVQTFDVSYPLALSSKKDRYLPTKLTPSNRRRRVSIEVHKVLPQFEEDKQSTSSSSSRRVQENGNSKAVDANTAPEICYVKILMNTAANPIESLLLHRKLKRRKEKQLKEQAAYVSDDDDDDGGPGSIVDADDMTSTHSVDTSTNNEELGDWFAKYNVPLKRFDIIDRKKRTVMFSFLFRGLELRREFIFDTEEDATKFCTVIEREKQLLGCRAQARLDAALDGIQLKKGEQLSLLVDIVSATNLPTRGPDPYVVVRFNGKLIHKTGHLTNTKNPIWTLRKGSLFILNVGALELFEANEGLIFEVKDRDATKDDSLGAIGVSHRTIYNWKDGERKEFDLKALAGEKVYNEGKLVLRVRRATDHDVEFLEKYHKSSKKFSISDVADGSLLPTLETSGGGLKKLMKMHKKTEGGQTKYLVRPGPDPKRKLETEWLTKEQIEEEALKPSQSWLDIGSGNLGKVFVEILGCDGLPNKDAGSAFGNLTDAFVSLVYEDCCARTHTIDDSLSPRFMPWSRRAFIFNMLHTSSQLFVGVFDEDNHKSHELIGRVSVDLTNLIPNMIYMMKYDLYPTAKCNPRDKKCGTITIRLRLELEDERTLLLSSFQSPGSVYVNSESKKDFKVMHQTVHGSVDMKQYGLSTISQYVEELYDYLTVYYYLEDSFVSLVLWRGKSTIQVPVLRLWPLSIVWVDVSMPIHSLMAFLCMVAIVENPELIPSLFFGSIGWLLLAVMEARTSGPNPWRRCKSFQHYFISLIFGNGLLKPHDIAKNSNIELIKIKEEAWKKRVRDAERRAEEYAKEQEEYWKKMEALGDIDADLSVVKERFTIDPTRAYLYPIQQWLGWIVNILRITKNIVIWEESYFSFWFALVSFLLSVISLFVPWSLLTKWTLRIVVYVFMGPWMKIVDIYYFQQTEEESIEHENKLKSERQAYIADQLLQAQVLRENNTKLRDFKQYMFGKYITKVNILKKDRFVDKPLPESSAVVYSPKIQSLGELAMQEAGSNQVRVDGQQLVGEMIPRIYETPTTDAPIGKPTKKVDADIPNYNDSYGIAVAKISAIIVGAAVVSMYIVPRTLGTFRELATEDIPLRHQTFYS